MALTRTVKGKTPPNENILFVVETNANLNKIADLSPYKTVISEKIAAGKVDFLTFYEAQRRVHVAIYANKEKEISYKLEAIRIFSSKICKLANKEKHSTLRISGLKEVFSKTEAISFLEGIELCNYQFNRYKNKKKEENSLKAIAIEEGLLTTKELDEFSMVMNAVKFTKDIVNEPVITLTATALSKEIKKQGKSCGFSVEVLEKSQIEALNMGGLLGVNKGSIDPPTFNILTYKPKNARNKKPLIFIGKGVVYDTGGYSLKVGGIMQTMKCDMAGAAAVAGSISAIASNKLPLYVIGLIPATDNKINSNALVVDDIITMHDGTTVEVQNTDAEGRLILGDALSFAKKYDPELVIDLATLTGAAAAITGQYGSALMGTDKKYRKTLIQSGEETYERLAELPFWKEFDDLMKSDVADLRNIGGPVGGSSTAGKFLEHFTSYNWLHIDIAGPAFLKDAKDHHHKGASAVGVRLLYNFAKKFLTEIRK
ncbi:MAG: leucyl aminopeptidase family protein [Bacteroidota bacterium]